MGITLPIILFWDQESCKSGFEQASGPCRFLQPQDPHLWIWGIGLGLGYLLHPPSEVWEAHIPSLLRKTLAVFQGKQTSQLQMSKCVLCEVGVCFAVFEIGTPASYPYSHCLIPPRELVLKGWLCLTFLICEMETSRT